MNDYPLLAGAIGVFTSGVLLLFSVIVPRWLVSKAVHELEVFRPGAGRMSKKESMLFGMVVHLIFSLFFGVLFGAAVMTGILSVNAVSMLIYFFVMSLFLGGVVLPLEGHGLFGWKEDHWIPVDLLAMNALWILIFWALLAVLG